MDNMKSTITERGDHWHPDPEKDKKLGGPGANQRAREDRAAASKPKSDPKKRKSGESYMDYAKRHGYKKSTPKKKSLLGRLGLRKEAYRVLAKDKGEEGKPSQFSYKDEKDAKKFADGINKKGGKATVTKEHHVEEGKGYQPEIEHSKLGDAKKKADKKKESKLPPHLQGDAIGKMKKAFAHTNESVDLTEEWIDSAVEVASDYFFSEGINEEGLDQIIDEVGLEDFVDFVIDPIEELNEERSARKASAKAPSYAKVKAKVDAGDAARKKAGKGEYADTAAAKRNYGDEEAPEGKTAKKKAVAKVTVRKPKAAPKKKAATVKKVEKAVKTAKKTQPTKPTSKKGLLGRVGDAVKKGVERHNKARAAGKVPEKRVKEFAKGFKKGVSGTVKFAGKVKKAVSEESELVDEKISASGYARAKKWREDQAREKDRKNNPEFYAMQDKIRAAKAKRKDKAEKNLASNMKKEELQVDEGIGDMAIKAIEKTNPPHISKRSDMMRKIKLKQLKSYLKKQDEKKKKAASKD